MVSISQLKKRNKARFMKEATKLANEYSKTISHHVSSNFTRFANDCFNLVDKHTCECTKLKCACGKKSVGFFGVTGEIQRPVCKKCLANLENEAENGTA